MNFLNTLVSGWTFIQTYQWYRYVVGHSSRRAYQAARWIHRNWPDAA